MLTRLNASEPDKAEPPPVCIANSTVPSLTIFQFHSNGQNRDAEPVLSREQSGRQRTESV